MQHEYEQRRADSVIKAGAGGLRFCSSAFLAYGRRHLWVPLTQGRECGAREFVEDFHPLLWLVLQAPGMWCRVGPGVDFSYHAHPIQSDGTCSNLLPFEYLHYLFSFKNNKEPQKPRV